MVLPQSSIDGFTKRKDEPGNKQKYPRVSFMASVHVVEHELSVRNISINSDKLRSIYYISPF